MKIIFTFIKKELSEIFRDKKVLVSAILIPLLTFPIIFLGITKLIEYKSKEEKEKINVVYIENADQIAGLTKMFEDANFEITKEKPTISYDSLIKSEKVASVIVIPKDFKENLISKKPNEIIVKFNSSDLFVENKVNAVLNVVIAKYQAERLQALNINQAELEPVKIVSQDIASVKEKFGKVAGGFLPYLFVILGFTGCMYASIDLFAGEKERKTIETLLTFPVNRNKILISKIATIVIVGLLSLTASIVGMVIAFKMNDSEAMSQFVTLDTITTQDIIMVLALMLPLMVFFAGILSPVSIYSKSYKEAASITGQMIMIIIFPAMIAMIPGVELTLTTALIPIVNLSLAIKDIVSGTIDYSLYAVTFISLIAWSVLAVWFSKKRFESEKSLLS